MWPFTEMREDLTVAPMKIVNGLLEPILEDALKKEERSKNSDDKETEDDTLLSHLVKETKGGS